MEGENIILRALEPEDLSFIYIVENNVDNWDISETKIPFSKYLLHEYLQNIGDDITKSHPFYVLYSSLPFPQF